MITSWAGGKSRPSDVCVTEGGAREFPAENATTAGVSRRLQREHAERRRLPTRLRVVLLQLARAIRVALQARLHVVQHHLQVIRLHLADRGVDLRELALVAL